MLYRGVSKKMHEEMEGRLVPKGNDVQTVMTRSDFEAGVVFTRGDDPEGRFTRTHSEQNTIRAHHLKSGFHDGSFISTTTDIDLARTFATNNGREEGYIYVIAPELFDKHKVVARKDPKPKYPSEYEVSIRAEDGGEIPKGIIVNTIQA